MSKENIFDLSKLVSDNDVEVKSANQNIDQDALLQGYQIIEPANWNKIPYKTHIRYLRTDGKFIKGGYLIGVINAFDQNNQPTLKFDLMSNFSSSAVKWSIYKGNISKIWGKAETMVAQPNIEVTALKEEITYLKQSIDQMRQKIQQMENESIRTLKLIKKLHNIV